MTTEQFYQSTIIKLNENATTDKISLDKGRFCVLANNVTNRLIEVFLDRKFEDDIRYIQKILVHDLSIPSSKKLKDFAEFSLPKDYFDFSNLFCTATKDVCERKKIDCFEIKDDDTNGILRDSNNNPSFKHRETPFHLASDKLIIYTSDDFTIDRAILSYYRYPIQVGLKDPENPESEFNSNNPEFDDKFMNRVIDLLAAEFLLNTDDPKFQAEKQNAITKN